MLFDLCVANCKECSGIEVKKICDIFYKCEKTGKTLIFVKDRDRLEEYKGW